MLRPVYIVLSLILFNVGEGLVDEHRLSSKLLRAEAHADVAALPDELRAVGLKLFGTKAALHNVLRRTSPPRRMRLHFPGVGQVSLHIVCDVNVKWKDLVLDTQGDEYRLQDLSSGPRLLVDIGANIGTQSVLAASLQRGVRVLAFEPVPTSYFYFLWNLYLNHIPLLSAMDLADSTKHGVVPLHRAVTADGRTVRMVWHGGGSTEVAMMQLGTFSRRMPSSGQSALVRSVKLRDFLARHGVTSIDELKIDCEGCEFENFLAMSDLVCMRSNVSYVSGEMHHRTKFHPEQRGLLPRKLVRKTLQLLSGCGCHVTDRWVECGSPGSTRT
eukprot:TRINITY_DN19191_c0_g1_i1.p1 TRINITY_DN19191_c0_g1~~TRINITY_DN19191_c0_g1_i1.p1  ORF type:complete len:328 (-),score=25.85 TRINITY_DN19191_c0_g1_i1:33-1016(-)